MTVFVRYLAAVTIACMVCCRAAASSPSSPPSSEVDGGPPADLSAACARLSILGCPEALPGLGGEPCDVRLRREADLVGVPSACVADAGTVAAVRACGDAATIRFRCAIAPRDGG